MSTEPSSFNARSGMWTSNSSAVCCGSSVGRTVIGGRRPVLVDRCGRGYAQSIGAVLRRSCPLVLACHQVKLARAKSFGAEEGHRIGHRAIVDRIAVPVGEVRRHALDDLVGGRHVPVAALEERRRKVRRLKSLASQECASWAAASRSAESCRRARTAALLDANRLQRVDHRHVTTSHGSVCTMRSVNRRTGRRRESSRRKVCRIASTNVVCGGSAAVEGGYTRTRSP